MAKALIINDPYGQLVQPYYQRFPEEPISAKVRLSVENPELIERMSLDGLLSAILKTLKDPKVGKDFVIVSHGNENGMLMGLYPGHPKKAVSDNLELLMSSETRDTKAERLSLKPQLVDDLIAKADQVRKLGLGHVAFRGCTIGEKPRNLTMLKDFLGAKTVSGTNLLSTFGTGKPMVVKDKKKFEAWFKKFENSGNIFGDPAQVIFATSPGKEPYSEIVYLFLTSEDALFDWLQTRTYAKTTKADASAVKVATPLHWLSRKPPALPLDGTVKNGPGVGYADFIRDTDTPP